jgi:hypothetical protein
VLARGADWTCYDVRELDADPPDSSPPSVEAPRPAQVLAPGRQFVVESVDADTLHVSPGQTVLLRLGLVARPGSSSPPQRIFVRLEGDMPPVPPLARGFSKLWRKLVSERSGRSAARFGQYVVPADLVVPEAEWPEGRWVQSERIRIPDWAPPGDYALQLTVEDWTWHPSRTWRDYLLDRDRFSGPTLLVLHVGS